MKIGLMGYNIEWRRQGEDAPPSREHAAEPNQGNSKILARLPFEIRLGERAVAERLRSELTTRAEKSIQSILAREESGKITLLAAPGDTAWKKKNEEIANEALKMVRLALYNKNLGSYKSSNKFKLTEVKAETKRLNKGTAAQMHDFDVTDPRHVAALRSRSIWASTKINCVGLAVAVQDYVSHKYPNIQTSSLYLGTNHTFAVVGTVHAEWIKSPIDAWPAHLYVCDPWANIVCSAPEYSARFVEKMDKWEKDNKQIYNSNRQWISPVDEKWLSCVSEIPKVFTRINYENEQFVEAPWTH